MTNFFQANSGALRLLLSLLSGGVVIRFSNVIFSFGVSVFLARNLGIEQFGLYSFIIAVVTILAVPAQGGIPQLIIRETAILKNKGIINDAPGLWFWALKLIVVISVVITLILLFVSIFDSSNSKAWFLASFLTFLLALNQYRAAILKGLDRVLIGQLPDNIARPGLLLLLVVVAANASVERAILLNLAATVMAFLMGTILLYKIGYSKNKNRKKFPSEQRKEWLHSVVPLMLVSSIQILNTNADILMLGLIGTDEQVGAYKVAAQLGLISAFGIQSIQMGIMPMVARLYHSGDFFQIQRFAALGSIAAASFTLFCLIMYYYNGDWILIRVFGLDYASAYLPLLVLVFGYTISAALGPAATVLMMVGKEKVAVSGVLVSLFINIILNLILIPTYGMLGAAYATLVGMVCSKLYMTIALQKQLGFGVSVLKLRSSVENRK